jgi:hypothetical protein
VRIPLDIEGLAAGVYTVDAGGVTATFELAVDNHTPQDPTWELSPCEALQGEGEAAFTNPSAGYCLRYPADFAVTEPEPGVVVIHGPDHSGGGLEPLAGFVAIETGEPANGRTARQVSDDVVSGLDLAGGVMVERVDGYLGGVPAVEIIGIPGQRLYRQVVAVQNDRVVDLVFSPIGEEYGQATADMETLYQLVMRSFTFVAPDGSAEHPQAAQGARFVLAQRLDVPQTAVEVVSAEPTTWSDACLGLGRPDEGCAAVLTPGYVVTLMVGDATYVYRADEAGGNIRLASSPEGAGEAQVLTLPLEDEQMRLTLPQGWSVGATRETVLGTLTVVGAAPLDPQAGNSAIYVADTTDVPLVHAVKRIFCGPSDCEPDVLVEDVVVGGVPAQRSVPADGVKVTWYFLIHDGKTITFTLHDPATQETLPDVIDSIRFEPSG